MFIKENALENGSHFVLMCIIYCDVLLHDRIHIYMLSYLQSNLSYNPHQIQNLNVSRLVLPLSLRNPLKLGFKLRMKM